MIGPFFEGGIGLDLFAGTGSLGIEALSRGLEHVVFVDRHRPAIRTIQANLRTLGLQEQAEVLYMDARTALARLRDEGRQFDFVFLDPPYELGAAPLAWLQQAGEGQLLAPEAIVVLEHDARVAVPEQTGTLQMIKHRRYGNTMLTVYSHT